MVGGVVVERGDVGGVGGIVGDQKGCWSVGVQLWLDALAKMGGSPSRQVGLGVEWQGEGGV